MKQLSAFVDWWMNNLVIDTYYYHPWQVGYPKINLTPLLLILPFAWLDSWMDDMEFLVVKRRWGARWVEL